MHRGVLSFVVYRNKDRCWQSLLVSCAKISKCDKYTTIFCLDDPPIGPLFSLFSRSLLWGMKNVPFYRPASSYDEHIVRQDLFRGGNKTRNNVQKKVKHLVFTKQLLLLLVGKSAHGQDPSLVLLCLCM